jgi:hypothetical protein
LEAVVSYCYIGTVRGWHRACRSGCVCLCAAAPLCACAAGMSVIGVGSWLLPKEDAHERVVALLVGCALLSLGSLGGPAFFTLSVKQVEALPGKPCTAYHCMQCVGISMG